MEIQRERYLNKIISFMWDGQVKVITGIRRCGKSYLLRRLFYQYLLEQGVLPEHILSFYSPARCGIRLYAVLISDV